MARMPSGTPTKVIRADEWLPGESVTIRTYQGEALRGAIEDAVLSLTQQADGSRTIQPTANKAALLKLRGHIVGWTLFTEDEQGAPGASIPFSPEAIDDLPPEYARFILGEITKATAAWRTATRGGDDPEAKKTFQEAAV